MMGANMQPFRKSDNWFVMPIPNDRLQSLSKPSRRVGEYEELLEPEELADVTERECDELTPQACHHLVSRYH
jgi:hypothetical protein